MQKQTVALTQLYHHYFNNIIYFHHLYADTDESVLSKKQVNFYLKCMIAIYDYVNVNGYYVNLLINN